MVASMEGHLDRSDGRDRIDTMTAWCGSHLTVEPLPPHLNPLLALISSDDENKELNLMTADAHGVIIPGLVNQPTAKLACGHSASSTRKRRHAIWGRECLGPTTLRPTPLRAMPAWK